MNKYWIAGIVIMAFVAGFLTNGWRLNAEIADLNKEKAETISSQYQSAIKDLNDSAEKINKAAATAQTDNSNLFATLNTINRNVKNAKPLPIDCKPDDVRMRNISEAVRATNQAIVRPVPSR